jgi:hypothetical protein
VAQHGASAHGELLEPGRVADCYLGLLLPPGPAGEPEAGTVLVVAPAALLHPGVPQPAGSLVYALLTGHPEREPGALVFVADLTVELRAWPRDTWMAVGVDPEQVAQAVVGCRSLHSQPFGLGWRRQVTRSSSLPTRLPRVLWALANEAVVAEDGPSPSGPHWSRCRQVRTIVVVAGRAPRVP